MAGRKTLFTNALLGLTAIAQAKHQPCKARNLPAIEVDGLEIIDLKSTETRDLTEWGLSPVGTTIPFDHKAVSFCAVTVTYTHPGQNDTVNVAIALPLDDTWNGKYLGMGGGGWAAGDYDALASGVALGYATANTDGGHSYVPDAKFDFALNAESWGYLSKGNVHWVAIQNFASRSLDDLPKIAKQVIQGFYGTPPKYSYWSGCSTGGRQGLMSAQRFPKNYDGILSVAPAINWATFLVAELWPQIVMKRENYWPEPAEFEAIRLAALNECDELDGVKDGVISSPKSCNFDATSVVGQKYASGNEQRKISAKAADVANAIWEGAMRDGKRKWFGNTHDTPFGGPGPFDGLASTACDAQNKNCQGIVFPISENWNKLFLQKDSDFDFTQMTEEDFWSAMAKSRREFTSIMDTADADLSEFKAAGGKIINWHGLADQLIPPGGMTHYYERVLAMDPDTPSFYKYFEAPGVGHCSGGPGAFPGNALNSLVAWVEKGEPPASLEAATVPSSPSEAVKTRILCPWPQVAAYNGGNPNKASSFECADTIDKFSSKWGEWDAHNEL